MNAGNPTEELGKADPDDLRSGPTDLPQMFREDESHQRDRGSGRHQKDPQAPRSMGAHAQAPTPNPESALPTRRASFDYSDSQLPSFDRVRCNVNLILKEASCP